jgi:hypothetical protein
MPTWVNSYKTVVSAWDNEATSLNSLTFPKVKCVIDTSSNLMLNSPARCNRSALILDDTYTHIITFHDVPIKLMSLTTSLCVINSAASNCATMLFSTSFPMDGRTLSS